MGVQSQYQVGQKGDIRFCAPEVIKSKRYNFKADAWSFGVILYYMLTGQLPFNDLSTSEDRRKCTSFLPNISIEEQILTQDPHLGIITANGYSKKSIQLVLKLLDKNPDTRLSLSEAVKDSWFRSNFDEFSPR
jgi:carbon catabolite-derepressing protein kinase